MTDKEKIPYEEKNKEDIKRYEKQLKSLETKGYFKMSDGTRSD
jgi:hypothetical protein